MYTIQRRNMLLNDIDWNSVPHANINNYLWDENGYKPLAYAQVVVNEDGICVKLTAYEGELRNECTKHNSMVCNDSCLEFFLNPDSANSDEYLNFELNPIGTLHLAIGANRYNRRYLPADGDRSIFQITYHVEDGKLWSVRFIIPYHFISSCYPKFDSNKMSSIMGNFMKCGEQMRFPHHGTFAPINTIKPDFHRPEFFTILEIEEETIMFKSINEWSVARGTTKERLELIKDAGFSAYEPAFSETGEISLESSDEQIIAIRTLADELGIKLVSLASGLYWKYSLTSNNEATREKGKSIVRRQLECAKLLGVDTILVVPGAVGNGFWGGTDFVAYEVAYERALAAMKELAPYAEKLGVNIGVENVWNNFLLSPLEFAAFIDAVGSPFVGAYFDVGNVVLQSFPEMWIKILGKRIKKIHVKDFRRSVGTLSGFVDLLCGDVNFPAVVKALKDVGYHGPLTAEMGTNEAYSGNIVYRTSRALDLILKG